MPDLISNIVYLFSVQARRLLGTRLSKIILLERGIHISAIIKDEMQFECWEDTLPFYYNVRREGVEIGAE